VRSLPKSANSLLVRSARRGSTEWKLLLAAVGSENDDGFRAYVDAVDSRRWYGEDVRVLRAAMPPTDASVLFVADDIAVATPDFPILVVDLRDGRPPFRCIAAELWAVDNNLNVSNMDWEDFADAVDQKGVYRGLI